MRRLLLLSGMAGSLCFIGWGCAEHQPAVYTEGATKAGYSAHSVSWPVDSGVVTYRHVESGRHPDSIGRMPGHAAIDRREHPVSKHGDAPARDSPSVVVTLPQPRPARMAVDMAMFEKFTGHWIVDVDETWRENAFLKDEIRNSIRQNLERNPFELDITNGFYVSRGEIETIADRFHVMSVEGDSATIQFDPRRDEPVDVDRRIRLSLRRGKLLINSSLPFACVMKRKSDPADRRLRAAESQTSK